MEEDFKSPTYVPTPYETYIKLDDRDKDESYKFKNWFHSSADNTVVEKTLTLSSVGKRDPVNDKTVFKYWNDAFWAVNGAGYGPEGQRDCEGKEAVNMG